jgi:hypothetical protein
MCGEFSEGDGRAVGVRSGGIVYGSGPPFDVRDYRQILYSPDDLLSAEESLTRFVQTALGIEPNR